MANNSLLGAERAPRIPRGRDAADLGPSDSSDSGSDVAGIGDTDQGDPGLPVDAAADPDSQRSDTVADAFSPGADSDHAGTGERRSAAGDAGRREAADIGPDRVVGSPDEAGVHEDLLSDGEPAASDDTDDMDLLASDGEEEDEEEGSGRPSP
jgi:hypothetical protein